MTRRTILPHVGFFFVVVMAWIALGTILGGVLFPTLGPLFGHQGSAAELFRHGIKFGSFYFMIWAPGIALVLAVMRAYRQKKAEPIFSAPQERNLRDQ